MYGTFYQTDKRLVPRSPSVYYRRAQSSNWQPHTSTSAKQGHFGASLNVGRGQNRVLFTLMSLLRLLSPFFPKPEL
jgi:hypothetical protein